MKKILRFFALLLLCSVLLIVSYGGYHYWKVQQPISKESKPVTFTIEKNATTKKILAKLQAQGLISNAVFANVYVRLHNITGFKAGDFELSKNMDLKSILSDLTSLEKAKEGMADVDIIDGYWLKDVARAIASKTNVKEEELMALWNNRTWIESQMPYYPFLTKDIFNEGVRHSLEGYFSPAKYYFHKKTTAEEVTKILLNQSLTVFKKFMNDFPNSTLNIREVYTLASIVQYEAGSKLEEAKMVAGIFLNRLKLKMPLGSSSSICYAMDVDRSKGDWKACEVNTNVSSPYNTYRNIGLPPGPINNPSPTVLEAVLHPTPSDYQFFLHDTKTGQVYYAKSYEEHQKNVREHVDLKS